MLKNALVTGASSGIGRELVRQLVLDRRMTVLATARRRDRLETLAAELPADQVLILDGDLASHEFRARLWAEAEALPGGCDLLVNNAGLGHYAEFADQPFAVVQQIIEVNVVALFDLTQRALPSMIRRGRGQVLQVSSVLGSFGIPYSAAYVASKHAVNGLVRSLRCELRGTGVRVWAACPGRTASEFTSVALGRPGGPGRVRPGAATDRVVREIVRELSGRKAFLTPTVQAKALAWGAHWLRGPFAWAMERWGTRHLRDELEKARRSSEVDEAAGP